jgi:hypothetical protein
MLGEVSTAASFFFQALDQFFVHFLNACTLEITVQLEWWLGLFSCCLASMLILEPSFFWVNS